MAKHLTRKTIYHIYLAVVEALILCEELSCMKYDAAKRKMHIPEGVRNTEVGLVVFLLRSII